MSKSICLELIQSLESYRDGSLSGNELLKLWENTVLEFRPIYYNLCHLVADEDIRQDDKEYSDMQIRQLNILIYGLQHNENIENLKQISFL
ncbi:hypothetical protein [Conchiformibius steedae]|uniref:hypothetical protein n=1 Tax=Conchiformibius steedae TaxID=153493 RepID=UPI0026F36F02|nr:hypothetical protein [Conchiformibius steedae]